MMNETRTPNSTRIMAKMATAFLTWRRYLQTLLLPHKITLKQSYVLRQLTRKEYLYPSQIAAMLYCDRPTATVIIRNMQKAGWVNKEKDPENRKFVRISITDAGRQKRKELANAPKLEPEFDPLGCLSEDEKCEFERLLDKINEHVKEIRRD